MRIAVTGGSGNVGTATLRRLSERGDHQEVALARRVPAARPGADPVARVATDLSKDACLPTPDDAFAGADSVTHLAWGFQPSHEPGYLEQLGVGGTQRVLGAAERADERHVVHRSSVGAYSPRADDSPMDESWPTGGLPSSAYSRHQAAAGRVLDAFEQSTRTLVSRMRPGTIGPSRVMRPPISAAWHAHLQQADPGWLDLALVVPQLATRAARPLGWAPHVAAESVLREVLAGMRHHDVAMTPALRSRTVVRAAIDAVRRGSVGRRRRA